MVTRYAENTRLAILGTLVVVILDSGLGVGNLVSLVAVVAGLTFAADQRRRAYREENPYPLKRFETFLALPPLAWTYFVLNGELTGILTQPIVNHGIGSHGALTFLWATEAALVAVLISAFVTPILWLFYRRLAPAAAAIAAAPVSWLEAQSVDVPPKPTGASAVELWEMATPMALSPLVVWGSIRIAGIFSLKVRA